MCSRRRRRVRPFCGDPPVDPPAKKTAGCTPMASFRCSLPTRRREGLVLTIAAEDEVVTTPVGVGDLLLFGTINGGLHAVRLDQSR